MDAKLKRHLLDLQQPDGSWNLFPGGEGDLSTSIEAYFALKLTGMRAGDEPMMQARRWILVARRNRALGDARAVLSGGHEPGAVGLHDRLAGGMDAHA